VDKSLSVIKANVDKLQTSINMVGWIVVAAIVTAIMKFVLDGGLNIVP